ncbi:hypothetical protein PENSPDRAFT_667642 [Peniophora sp. CONT]|nr:hypothetical protein PENSPDRAFT_667642 [Peniophora sp. CONT]
MALLEDSNSVIYMTQNFDDDIRALDKNLVAIKTASCGEYGFTKRSREELVDLWRSIESNSAMLHIVLPEFRRRHLTLIKFLSSPYLLGQSFREDLPERAKAAREASGMDQSSTYDVWQGFIELDYKSHLYITWNRTWEGTERGSGSSIAVQLEIAINWIEGAIDVLREGYTQIEHARAVLTPVFRLNADILAIIFEQLAGLEAPTRSSLGWIRLSHVCVVWRQVLLDMHNLWARDAYIFGPDTARQHILSRAQECLISVSAMRLPASDGEGPPLGCDHVVRLASTDDVVELSRMAAKRSLRDLHVQVFPGRAMRTLADMIRILAKLEQPHLRSLNITVPCMVKDSKELPRIRMATHPVLRHIELVNIFIPFTLPHLSSLHLCCAIKPKSPGDSRITSSWLNGLLDALASSPALTDFRMVGWTMPPPPPQPRKITLDHLTTLCSTTSEILLFLELPALQRGYIADNGRTTNTYAGLTAVLTRYGYSPRSVQLSQRSASKMDNVIIRFGRIAEPWRPPIAVPFDAMTLLTDPGPYLTIVVPCPKTFTDRTLSAVFPVFASLVSRPSSADVIDTLGFDNETREHTFYGLSGSAYFDPMLLPAFPFVRTIELPLKDKNTMRHVLSSLAADQNVGHLPLLSCIRFIGPVDLVNNIAELHKPISSLLSARTSLQGVSPIKCLEVAAFPDTAHEAGDNDGVDLSKPVLSRMDVDNLGANAKLRVELSRFSNDLVNVASRESPARLTQLARRIFRRA